MPLEALLHDDPQNRRRSAPGIHEAVRQGAVELEAVAFAKARGIRSDMQGDLTFDDEPALLGRIADRQSGRDLPETGRLRPAAFRRIYPVASLLTR